MSEQSLRRELMAALDPGAEFPSANLLRETMGRLDRPLPSRPPFLVRASAIVISIAVVLGLMGAWLASRAQPAPGTSAVSGSPGPGFYPGSPTFPGLAAVGMHMVSPTVGWLGDQFYQTTDGGLTWIRLGSEPPIRIPGGRLPPPLDNLFTYSDPSGFALDPHHAWVVVTVGTAADSSPSGIAIWLTVDGGQTWTGEGAFGVGAVEGQSDIPVEPNGVQVDFVDAAHGWIEVDWATGVSSSHHVLYGSSDGGFTWHQLTSATSFGGSDLGTTAAGCPSSGLTFTDARRGWLTLDCRLSGGGHQGPEVFETTDGGLTWQVAAMRGYPQPATGSCGATPPLFSGQHGILSVTCDVGAGYMGPTEIFQTRDGKTWTPLPLPAWLEAPRQLTFVNPNVGWALDASGTKIYGTTDGGRSWRFLSAPRLYLPPGMTLIGADLGGLVFLDTRIGFTYIELQGPSLVAVLRTTDGGHHWSFVNPVLAPSPG